MHFCFSRPRAKGAHAGAVVHAIGPSCLYILHNLPAGPALTFFVTLPDLPLSNIKGTSPQT